jgi:predicted pyridoxine 5'-phosphate oxidase superfamily flavin-nucleotide-binding protein
MKMPEEIKEIFNNAPIHQLATSSGAGIPNVCNVGARYLLDDETIIVVDNYMKKTLSNIMENPVVAILVRIEKESYQIKGRCSYLDSGPIYEEARKWMRSRGEKYPVKGALKIRVEEVFNSAGGPGSGDKIV